MKKFSLLALCSILMLAACKKTDFDTEVKGEALGNFTITGPAASSHLLLNAATPDKLVEISWTPARPGVNTPPTYTFLLIQSDGSFDQPLVSLPSNNNGSATSFSITYQAINDALTAAGITAGATADLMWAIRADNGSTQVLSTIYPISITTMSEGATEFILLAPASSTNTISINPTSSSDMVEFKWTSSTPSQGAPAIHYTVVFQPENDADPIRVPSDDDGSDTVLNISQAALATLLSNAGYTDFSQVVHLKWHVEAVTGSWTQPSAYENDVAFLREVNMYLVGDLNGWNIDEGIKMIVDRERYGKVYYSYIYLTAGTNFKFFQVQGDWGSGYGRTEETDPALGNGVKTGYNVGGDINIAADGLYRLTIDVENNVYWVQQRQVGVVGSMQGWNAGSPLFGTYTGNNSFTILANTTAGDEFKFHEGDDWDNSNPWGTRFFGTGDGEGVLSENGGSGNITTPYTGVSRLIFNGSNVQQLTYEVKQAEMRLRGDNEFGGWDWGNAVQMTYEGNGIWRGVVTLAGPASFKFCGTEDWSVNYGDAGGGKAEFNHSDNFSLGAGSWEIIFNEYLLTVTTHSD